MSFSPFAYGYGLGQLTAEQREQLKERLEAEIRSTENRLDDMKRILKELQALDK